MQSGLPWISLPTSAQASAVLEIKDNYFVVYPSEETIRRIVPDFARLGKLHPFGVAVTAPGKDADFVSRYFAPSYGIPEDPVTGSTHCSLAPYWGKRLGKTNCMLAKFPPAVVNFGANSLASE
jgi:predicted PhzF superfamily epimerase YddE/YHI9